MGDLLPKSGDDVIINAPGDIEVLFDVSEPLQLGSLTSDEHLRLSDGDLRVSGPVSFASGRSLVVDSAAFEALGTTSIDAVSVRAVNGAQVVLSGMGSYANDSVNSFRAEGSGSVLSLPNLETISSALGQYVTTRFEAVGGGTVQIGSEVSQTHSSGSVQFIADGGSESITSVLDAPNLTQF
ncbi:MAG: hypothetical protein AAF958_08100, partial [Planctomycetota bacterium]